MLLGAIIEKVSGKSYEAFVKERIFGPLGMTSSYYGSTEPVIPRRVPGYTEDEGQVRNAGEYELSPTFVLTISVEGDRLMSQATGQQKIEIFPASDTEFFLKVVDAQISFVRKPDGTVDQLVLHQGGRDIPARRKK